MGGTEGDRAMNDCVPVSGDHGFTTCPQGISELACLMVLHIIQPQAGLCGRSQQETMAIGHETDRTRKLHTCNGYLLDGDRLEKLGTQLLHAHKGTQQKGIPNNAMIFHDGFFYYYLTIGIFKTRYTAIPHPTPYGGWHPEWHGASHGRSVRRAPHNCLHPTRSMPSGKESGVRPACHSPA